MNFNQNSLMPFHEMLLFMSGWYGFTAALCDEKCRRHFLVLKFSVVDNEMIEATILAKQHLCLIPLLIFPELFGLGEY